MTKKRRPNPPRKDSVQYLSHDAERQDGPIPRAHGPLHLGSPRRLLPLGGLAALLGVVVVSLTTASSPKHHPSRPPSNAAQYAALNHGIPLEFQAGPFNIILLKSLLTPTPRFVAQVYYRGSVASIKALNIAWGPWYMTQGEWRVAAGEPDARGYIAHNSLRTRAAPGPAAPITVTWDTSTQKKIVDYLKQAQQLTVNKQQTLVSHNQTWSAVYTTETLIGPSGRYAYGELLVHRKGDRPFPPNLLYDPSLWSEAQLFEGLPQHLLPVSQHSDWSVVEPSRVQAIASQSHLTLSWKGHTQKLTLEPRPAKCIVPPLKARPQGPLPALAQAGQGDCLNYR